MSRPHANEDGDGIISLVRETADGLGHLIADHIRLARVEMAADAKEYGKRVAVLAMAASFLLFGYAFAWIALALALARWIGAPLAFVAVAAVHLVGGGAGLAVALGKLRKARLMDETRSEVNRSVTALSAQMGAGAGPARAPSPQ
jgi:uncharacterized membrane protein YqjE